MDLVKISMADVRGFDKAKAKEVEAQYRKELANMRMDIYTASAHSAGKKRALKKGLARLLTVKRETEIKKAK